jgi:outer membrane putative beta-barrel porin/alpha-amylase
LELEEKHAAMRVSQTRNGQTATETSGVRWALRFLILIFLLSPAWAQEDVDDQIQNPEILRRDRPIVVRAKDLENSQQQIEIDVRVTRDRDGTPIKLRLPVLYRVDTGPDTEFRISSDFLTYQNPNLGFSDTVLGFKWNFAKGRSAWSLVGDLELPSGSAGFADPGAEPGITIIYDQKLGDKWELVMNASLEAERDADTLEYYGQWNSAIQLGRSVSQNTQIHGAIIVKSPDRLSDGITRISGALGMTHSLNPRNQLNLTMGRSFSATGDDYEFIFGWSHRY